MVQGPARLEIRLLMGEQVVHAFVRSTTMLQPDSIPRLLTSGLGWLQAYSGQASNEQFIMDAEHAELSASRVAQLLAEDVVE